MSSPSEKGWKLSKTPGPFLVQNRFPFAEKTLVSSSPFPQCLKRDWDSGVLPMAPQASNGGSGGSAKDCRLPILPVLSGSGKLQLIKFTIFKWILFKFFSFLIVLWRFMRCLFRFYKMFWREGK